MCIICTLRKKCSFTITLRCWMTSKRHCPRKTLTSCIIYIFLWFFCLLMMCLGPLNGTGRSVNQSYSYGNPFRDSQETKIPFALGASYIPPGYLPAAHQLSNSLHFSRCGFFQISCHFSQHYTRCFGERSTPAKLSEDRGCVYLFGWDAAKEVTSVLVPISLAIGELACTFRQEG